MRLRVCDNQEIKGKQIMRKAFLKEANYGGCFFKGSMFWCIHLTRMKLWQKRGIKGRKLHVLRRRKLWRQHFKWKQIMT